MGRHREGLNAEQEQAVLTVDGPLLVLAGAGTGKTRVVTCRIAEIIHRGTPPAAILAVTFTNKAAREMRERTAKLLRGRDVSGMVVSTFHSLGLRILRRHGEPVGVRPGATIADAADQLALVSDACREVGLARNQIRPQDARHRISLWKNAARTPEFVLEEAEDTLEARLSRVYSRYEEELRRRNLLDFDDLILKTLRLLEAHEDTRERLRNTWRYMLVDEYQDTNECQYRLIRALAGGHRNICVVGDDDQSIYGWRGADAGRILGFSRDFRGARVITLVRNYRSTAPILEAANRLISCNLSRREKRLIPRQAGGQPVTLFVADDEKGETDFVASRIVQLHMQEKMSWQSCAVLFRANSQCRSLEQALRERRIPYRVVGTRSFFDRREIRDLLSYLRLTFNENDDQAFLRIANTPPRGIGRGTLDRLMERAAAARSGLLPALRAAGSALPPRAARGAGELLAVIRSVREKAASGGVAAALEHLVEATGYRHHLKQIADDALELKARLQAVDELIESAREFRPSGSGSAMESFLDSLTLQEEDRPDRERKEQAAVTLMTMHAAKGLEFPVVFIVGLEEGLIPHGNVVSDEDDGPNDTGIEEERRLLYVGLTRARERLFLTRAVTRRRFGRETIRPASRFLEEIGLEQLHVLKAGSEPPAETSSARSWLASIRNKLADGSS